MDSVRRCKCLAFRYVSFLTTSIKDLGTIHFPVFSAFPFKNCVEQLAVGTVDNAAIQFLKIDACGKFGLMPQALADDR